ncbi:hypothetical protein VCHC57A2_2492, partial [Vibrio cholerae HC-57A2]
MISVTVTSSPPIS